MPRNPLLLAKAVHRQPPVSRSTYAYNWLVSWHMWGVRIRTGKTLGLGKASLIGARRGSNVSSVKNQKTSGLCGYRKIRFRKVHLLCGSSIWNASRCLHYFQDHALHLKLQTLTLASVGRSLSPTIVLEGLWNVLLFEKHPVAQPLPRCCRRFRWKEKKAHKVRKKMDGFRHSLQLHKYAGFKLFLL